MLACNVGKTDKIIRLILGVAVIAAGFIFQNWFGLIGIALIFTAVFGRCSLYYPFRIDTTKKKNKNPES